MAQNDIRAQAEHVDTCRVKLLDEGNVNIERGHREFVPRALRITLWARWNWASWACLPL